ncbi:porin family protein [Confluentibacter sediminis]|uniref:porin family protein n=1 Tax=Confluentibacter sediminis TaxID=2219045 RepID=UPI000DAE3AD7|nr:porin family protein [Confluentibacter sediminis]
MKSIYFTILTVLICSVNYGQKLNYGLKGGMNVSNTKFTVLDNGESSARDFENRISYFISGFVEYFPKTKSNKPISIQTELQFSKQGYSYNRSSETGFVFQLDQMNLPLTLKKPILNDLSIVGGVYLGYVTSSNEKYQGRKYKQNEYFNFDNGLLVGGEYSFDFGLLLDFRYMYGLKNMSDFKSPESNIEHEYKNRVFQFGLGYRF